MAKGKYLEWLSLEGLIKLEGWARDGLTDEQIADNIGISRPTLYEWKKRYPDISDALKKGKEVVDRQVENALLKKALGYTVIETTKERIADTGQKQRHDGVQRLTDKQWRMCQSYFFNQCAYCGRQVKLTKDHLKPLDKGGQMDLFNIVPACNRCNSSKQDENWLSWFQKQSFYNAERAKHINDYMNFVVYLDVDGNETSKDEDNQLVITKEVTKEIGPDVGAIALWLKNRKPDSWHKANPADEQLKRSQAKLNEQQLAQLQGYENLDDNILLVDDLGVDDDTKTSD